MQVAMLSITLTNRQLLGYITPICLTTWFRTVLIEIMRVKDNIKTVIMIKII